MTAVRVAGVPEPYNLPWHLAQEKGHFAAAGVDLHWHTVPEGTGRMCQMLRDGELDMAVLVTEGAVRDILNGGPHRIVSGFVESPLPWGVHVPAAAALSTEEDLLGIPYAISRPGSGSHIMAMLHARRIGWQPGPDDLVVVHNMEGAAQRMSKGEPLIFLWETYVTSRYVRSGVMRHVGEVRGDWPGFVIVARSGMHADLQAAVVRTLRVLREEAERSVDEPHMVELVMQNAGFSEALAKDWLANVHWRMDPPTSTGLNGLKDTLERLQLVPRGSSGRFPLLG